MDLVDLDDSVDSFFGMVVQFTNNLTLDGLVVRGATVGLRVHRCKDIAVRNNRLVENTAFGVQTNDIAGQHVVSNNFVDETRLPTITRGVGIFGSSLTNDEPTVTITGNTVKRSGIIGIFFGPGAALLSNNFITDNAWSGMLLNNGDSEVEIVMNTFARNGQDPDKSVEFYGNDDTDITFVDAASEQAAMLKMNVADDGSVVVFTRT